VKKKLDSGRQVNKCAVGQRGGTAFFQSGAELLGKKKRKGQKKKRGTGRVFLLGGGDRKDIKNRQKKKDETGYKINDSIAGPFPLMLASH